MSEEIRNLKPSAIWGHFAELLAIPRPSKKEERIIAYMKQFGLGLGLETLVDACGNVIIRKPATAGMENRKCVILQGHLDMVPQKNSDTQHDFENDPITAYVDGEWVKAKGTTLGADNGMGVAAAMAVLSATDLQHGPLEALFTIDEETGMTGAFELKGGVLKGEILLNLDSEDEGELYVGCAGGTNANVTFHYTPEAVPAGYAAFKISVKGLKGGHSGLDINLGRGNANKLLFRYIRHAADRHGLRLAAVEGGGLRNAIPREAFAIVVVPADRADKLPGCVAEYENHYKKELSVTEPDLKFSIEKADMPATLLDTKTQFTLTASVYGCPNGVIRMSDSLPGLTETSTSMGVIKSDGNTVKVHCLMRSSVDSSKEDLCHMIESVFSLAGADVMFDGSYPGWKPNPNSLILGVMQNVYQQKFGKIPEIKAIHAGLECGILSANYSHWDMISFGPTIRFPHSPDEKVNIPSVAKFYDFLTETLKNIPEKK